jgi:multidrug efflux pump
MMDGEEYDVIVEGERDLQNTAQDLQNIYVRSNTGELIPVSNLVEVREFAESNSLNRYNRVRAITIEAGLDGITLGEGLAYLEQKTRELLPEEAIIDYKGQSLDYKSTGGGIWFVYILGIVVVFLVLAAQFESYIHPTVIISTVPMAMLGGLLSLFVTGNSLNIYSQIGLIMLVGLAAKNGILIVEFANQLRDEGEEFMAALKRAAEIRFRPVVMTSITTAAGTIPLVLASGAGSASLVAIGVTVFGGVLVATALTLFLVPLMYSVMARNTGSPEQRAHQLEQEMSGKDSV